MTGTGEDLSPPTGTRSIVIISPYHRYSGDSSRQHSRTHEALRNFRRHLAAGYSTGWASSNRFPCLTDGLPTEVGRPVGDRRHWATSWWSRDSGGRKRKSVQPERAHAPIFNPRFSEGMFSSVQAGAASLSSSSRAFFLLPADIPTVRPATVRLLARYASFRELLPLSFRRSEASARYRSLLATPYPELHRRRRAEAFS